MRQSFRYYLAAVLALTMLGFGCSKAEHLPPGAAAPQAAPALKVATSNYVVYSIAAQVLSGAAEVTMLVPPAAEAHHFEPSAQTIIDVQNAAFFFYISDTLEPWALKISSGRGIALANYAPNKTGDPHLWMDFDNTAAMGEAIASAVARQYPDLEGKLLKNVLNFQNEISMLKRLYADGLKVCQSRAIYHVGHLAFGYIAQNYNLQFKPLIGATFDAEPSARDLANMIKQIKAAGVKYIFTEDAVNTKLAATISAESGAQVLRLYTIEFITKDEFLQKPPYRKFMTENLQNLIKGLGCN